MDGARHDHPRSFPQSVCLDGLAVAYEADRTRECSLPAIDTAAKGPTHEQDRGAPRRPEPLRPEPGRPARRRHVVQAGGANRARFDHGPTRMPAFLAAFVELRAALQPGIAKAAQSSTKPPACAPCRAPGNEWPGPHTTSHEVTAPAQGARATTRTASPGSLSTR